MRPRGGAGRFRRRDIVVWIRNLSRLIRSNSRCLA